MKADRILGIAVVGAGGLIALASSNIQVLQTGSTLSARFFPYLLAVMHAVGGLTLVLLPGKMPLGDALRRVFVPTTLLLAAVFAVYAFTFHYMDFRVGTWLFVLLAMVVLGARKPLELIVAPVVISLITFYLFRYGFMVMLPTWN